SVDLDLPPGFLLGHDLLNESGFFFKVDGRPEKGAEAELAFNGAFSPKEGTLAPGRVRLSVENRSEKRSSLLLMSLPPEYPQMAAPLDFPPYLSGKRLLTTQTFRDLFQAETIATTAGIGVKDITLLFTDLKGSTALYDRIGDLKAFALVQQHFERLGRVVRGRSGSIVKTIGDAVMASFMTPADAARAALEMLEVIDGFNDEQGTRELILKIGIHKGPSILVTLNDRLDYFGQTVNVAARVQALAEADEICLTEDVLQYPGVQELVVGLAGAPESVRLKGVSREVRLSRVKHSRRAAGLSAGIP
ncbi:MAG: adenylate/guanylate cyclase domain-containing protein, partial [Elusimicrobiota bacterium]